MDTENINGYVVMTVNGTFAVAHYGSQVVKAGTPDEVRAYCAPAPQPELLFVAVPYPRTDHKLWGITCPEHFDYFPTDTERCCAEAFAAAVACGTQL